MIYSKLEEIKSRIEDLNIFAKSHIHLGTEFNIGAKNLPVCVIKSGDGELSGHQVNAGVHIIAMFRDADNIEQTVDTHLGAIIREMNYIEDVQAGYYTTDENVMQPFGFSIPMAPPFGGFRIELTINESL